MRTGVVAKKLGMARLFGGGGDHIPVTVLQMEKTVVVDHKVRDTHGYTALVLGVEPVSGGRLRKPQRVFFEKKGQGFFRLLKEFRVTEENLLPVGTEITVEHFEPGHQIDVTGVTIGKGFAGVIKRHHFGGLRASHGVSISHRSHGSTGQRQDPGKVFKGKKMAGHMGHVRATQQNLQIVRVDQEKGLLFVRGSVPGAEQSMVYVCDAIKDKK